MQAWWFSRLAGVKRWGIVATQNMESVAEHSCQVAGIALWIYKKYSLRIDKGDLLEWALLHDMPEIYTGDLPTPMKTHVTTISKLNADFVDPPDDDLIIAIVKIADMAQTMHWLRINKKHTTHAMAVERLLHNEYLEKLNIYRSQFPEHERMWDDLRMLPQGLFDEVEW